MAENTQDAFDRYKTEPVTIVPPDTHPGVTPRESIARAKLTAEPVA